MPKTKQQEAQERRLQRNIRQAKTARADAKTSGNKTVRTRPPKRGGFFAGLKTDAPQTVQQSIPYKEMYRDGICRLNDKLYTKTVQFFDINYQLAQADDKAQIFEGYCDFLNYFDASIHVQLTFINQRANMQDFARSIDIPIRGDEYDGIRKEYGDMLKGQLQKGNNGLTKRKYITFGIEADDLRTAKMRLERIEADVLANFKALGAQAKPLNGLERLELLHSQLHPDGQEKFHFAWADLPKTGLSTKDFIAPSGLSFSNDGKTFRVADHSGALSFLQILAPELTDRLLAELLDLDDAVTVNLHIQSIDQAQAIRNIKRKMSDLQKMTIEEQKKAVRSGYDMDIIPTDLATYGEEAKNLLQDLQSRNERMFLVTVLVENIAPKRQKLFNDILSASGIAQKYNCALKRLDYQQEQGLMSSLALGVNQIEIERGLTTSSTAIFVPFTTCELFQEGEALYYGLNALSNNLIMANRKNLKNPNGLFLGTPGSGKSFSAKREIVNVFLLTEDDIIIADPENEYGPLVQQFGAQGQVIDISPTSTNYINPMDINLDYSDDENPITLKSDFILSLCDLVIGGKEGLSPIERNIIDRCTRLVYRDYLQDPRPENMPVLGDLYGLLLKQSEPEAQNIATALEIYVNGSLNVFNHRSNIDMDNHRVLCFQLKSLGKALKEIGLLIMQDSESAGAYEDVASHVELPEQTEAPEDDNTETEPAGEDTSVVLPTVDFDALRETGPDIIGWLTLPDTAINYPVTQKEDNEYYLHHLYDGTYNKVGCLFADYENQEDFSDRNTIIYGHNMRDGSMFATLNEYDEQSYYDGHPQMYLVTPGGGYIVEIFTAFVARPGESGSDTSPWRLSFKDDGAYTTWLSEMAGRSVIETDVTVTSSDKVLSLSTCTPGGASRFIVMGKLLEVE